MATKPRTESRRRAPRLEFYACHSFARWSPTQGVPTCDSWIYKIPPRFRKAKGRRQTRRFAAPIMAPSRTPLLRGRRGRSAVVLDDLVDGRADVCTCAMGAVHEDHVERSAGRHSGVAAISIPNAQLLPGVVPRERDRRILASLVVVRIAFVFVERERSVGALVDADLKRIDALGGVLRWLRGPRGRGRRARLRRHRPWCARAWTAAHRP